LRIQPQICQSGVVGGLNGLSVDSIRATRGTTAQIAGFQGERTRSEGPFYIDCARPGSVQQAIQILVCLFWARSSIDAAVACCSVRKLGWRSRGAAYKLVSMSCVDGGLFGCAGYVQMDAVVMRLIAQGSIQYDAVCVLCAILVSSYNQIGTGYGFRRL
jgi:hypothetical protein